MCVSSRLRPLRADGRPSLPACPSSHDSRLRPLTATSETPAEEAESGQFPPVTNPHLERHWVKPPFCKRHGNVLPTGGLGDSMEEQVAVN